jgi:hypothetical protein
MCYEDHGDFHLWRKVVWTGWRTGLAAKFKDFKKGV